jgi:CheY-like chemotaxis protein
MNYILEEPVYTAYMISKPKILVVDDEELTQDFFKLLLSSKYDVYTCGTVDDFYTNVTNHNFDLILMDIFLRDVKDGIQLTRETKNDARLKDVPIFLITAQNSAKDRQEALNAGAQVVLTKPVENKFLLNHIKETIASKMPIKV